MFEPEYLSVPCPRCHKVEVYFDREIGFYCMLCGHQYLMEEIQSVVETERLQDSQHRLGTDT